MPKETPKKKIGRPKKEKLPVGRPKGQEQIMKEYRMRMLRSPQSRKVLQSVFDVATDPEHKHWPAAMKMVMDRIVPASGFDENSLSGGGKPVITVNISGVPGVNIGGTQEETIDGDFTPVEADPEGDS